jgi:hypothetical protein
MRMIQAGNGPSFALKPLAQFGTIRKMRRQHLDRNDAVEPCISSPIHLAHPTRTNRGEDFVRP